MSNEKRFAFFVALMFVWLLGFPYILKFFGLAPPPQKKVPVAAATKEAGKTGADADAAAKAGSALAEKPAPETRAEKEGLKPGSGPETAEKARAESRVALIDSNDLVMGSAADKSPTGYRLEVQLEQKGAGVEAVSSSRFDAEFEGRVNPHRPLQLIRRDPVWPPSLALTLTDDAMAQKARQAQTLPAEEGTAPAGAELAARAEDWLDSVLWDVVRDDQKRTVRPLSREDPATHSTLEGQEVVFRTTAPSGVVVTKSFRL